MARAPSFIQRNKATFAWLWNRWRTAGTDSYNQQGGTGSRLGDITVTYAGRFQLWENVLNGMLDSVATFTAGAITAADNVTFNFKRKRVLKGYKVIMSGNGTHGVFQPRGSNDGSTFTNIGGTITLGSAGSNVTEYSLSGNTTSYQYFQLLGVSGTSAVTPKIAEVEFKFAAG
jgi:hypothetical protein